MLSFLRLLSRTSLYVLGPLNSSVPSRSVVLAPQAVVMPLPPLLPLPRVALPLPLPRVEGQVVV